MSNPISHVFTYGNHTISLETGRIARQADASVWVTVDEKTALLVTLVCAESTKPDQDFFGLSVFYTTKFYAGGRIPGGFFKREGRPSEDEVLVSRLIDRPLRPLFPKGFRHEVQVTVTLMSLDPHVDPVIPAILGVSAAAAISGLPVSGVLGAARVGFDAQNATFLLNPPAHALSESGMDLVVAGTDQGILMVESRINQLPESTVLDAVFFGHSQMQQAIGAIQAFAQAVRQAGLMPADVEWSVPTFPSDIQARLLSAEILQRIAQAYAMPAKTERQMALSLISDEVRKLALALEWPDSDKWTESQKRQAVTRLLEAEQSRYVRQRILAGHPRMDGRDTRTVRPISIQPGLLPCAHGSVLFTRGETQAIVAATLGTERDAQLVDAADGERKDPFMLHYNFPPYSVGEVGMMGSPKRREIGHGRLARRAMEPVLPGMEKFPYVLRLVSDITESNGSSSMATVCGASLALMDAGVPIEAPVAGIAMGLIKQGDQFAVLTDILGDEDHLGDMDFKVAGTALGVTALQMDIKISGITQAIMEQALSQAREARLHILQKMHQVLPVSRSELSPYAPRITTIRVDPDKIRDIIGKGGATIRALTEETGATIDISDDGLVKIAAVDQAAGEEAKRRIELLTADVEVGKVYFGRVVKIMEFGAFVNLLPGKDGLVHISQISEQRVTQVQDFLQEGQSVSVKVLEVDKQGRIKLSMKAAAVVEVADLK